MAESFNVEIKRRLIDQRHIYNSHLILTLVNFSFVDFTCEKERSCRVDLEYLCENYFHPSTCKRYRYIEYNMVSTF